MAVTQLSFALRTTSAIKTVHLIGSWDGYQGQIPLSKDSKGSWKGSFRFQTNILVPGQRYWFYYMLDGYQVTHDPSAEFTTEPTTGRKLNVLDVPVSKGAAAAHRAARRQSRLVPQGRAISPSNIKSPKPQRPGQTKHIVDGQYTQATLAALNARFAQASLEDDDDDDDDDSDSDSDEESDCSDVPSLTSGSSRSSCSSPSSVSSASSSCTCQRYGITREGHRVKLDCGGSRCGYSDDSCSESEGEAHNRANSTRRHGVVIRG